MKKSLISLLAASSIALGGCSATGPKVNSGEDFIRDVYEVTQKGGYISSHSNESKKIMEGITNYKAVIDMFETENECFQRQYIGLPYFEENKIENYAAFLSSMPKDQLNAMRTTYNTCLLTENRLNEKEEYIYKRITSGALAAFIAAGLSSSSASSINSNSGNVPSIGSGSSSRNIGNLTR